MPSPSLVFLGAGRLASGIVRGLLAQKVYAPGDIACTSKNGGSAQKLAADTGIKYEPDLPRLLASADTVVLAFKPSRSPASMPVSPNSPPASSSSP